MVTMDYLTRLKNSVTSALPGNPVTREFEVHHHRASAGPGLLWKVYDGIKRTTKQEVSVLVFEKKVLDRYSKRDKDIIIDSLKKGVTQLTKLRHPKILSVLHPLEESRESLAFATEPVFASLSNVLGSLDNMPSPVPNDLRDFKLYDVEIKYGLLQVTEGLAFLHNDVKMVHGNVCPQSIVINKSGAWKIAGFDFNILNANVGEQATGLSQPFYPFREWDPGVPPVAQPSLEYLAPEYALSATCDISSDMFSLGVFFYSCFTHGKTLYTCQNEYHRFKTNIEEVRNIRSGLLNAVPDDVRDHVKLLLNTEPTVRPDADQLSKIPFFEDVGSMTLQYLDTLMQRDNLQKSHFFKGLPKVIASMPKRVSLQRILPCLFKEAINPEMIPFLLPSILLIAEEANKDEYTRFILPDLIPIFKLTEPIQISLVFLQNMNLLLSKTPQADIQNHVLPMVYRALEYPMPQIQELCLSIIPTFASLIEYSNMKNALVPRIRKLCLGTSSLSIRVNSLVCLGKLLEYMDKWYVLDEIFPILQEVPSREPAVLMSILGIYKVTMTHKKLGVTKEVLATRVLPFIFPLAIDNNLNLGQFNAFMSTIHEMTEKVEQEQRSKLEQLNTIKQEQRSLHQFTTESVKEASSLVPGVKQPGDQQETMSCS